MYTGIPGGIIGIQGNHLALVNTNTKVATTIISVVLLNLYCAIFTDGTNRASDTIRVHFLGE